MKEDHNYWGMRDITPEQAYIVYAETLEFLRQYYKTEFDPSKFLPVIKDGYEHILNNMQFAGMYFCSIPTVPIEEKALMLAWITQAAFWMGYTEAKKTDEIELPKGFYEALGE